MLALVDGALLSQSQIAVFNSRFRKDTRGYADVQHHDQLAGRGPMLRPSPLA